ncbi:tubulin folding cofactor E [Actinidia rufa]|uniref:Tubulin folding cofactor E n=1 Tax=Actinidia rufa TaxID=165716 RepID=A0A7J0F9F9_9ERIC|nr:tubulin folding cofactor E [Actinidia rufa]
MLLGDLGFKSSSPPSSDIVEGFGSLRLLNLEDNCIADWNEILKLSQLKSLEQLQLNKNKLNRIWFPDYDIVQDQPSGCESVENSNRPFQNLCCLLLGCNNIDDLASIDSLNSFPSLVTFVLGYKQDTRLSENPIADPGKGGMPRFVLIARLAKVQMLNGSEVSPRERKDCEIRFNQHMLQVAASTLRVGCSWNQEDIVVLGYPLSAAFYAATIAEISTGPACPGSKKPWVIRAGTLDQMNGRALRPALSLSVQQLLKYSRVCGMLSYGIRSSGSACDHGSEGGVAVWYVRLVMSMFHNHPEEIMQLHPRFQGLKDFHGIEDEKTSIRPAGPQKMASGLISITLKCVGASIGEKLPLTKKLPATITVGKLKILCESFFKLKSVKPVLFLQEQGSPLPTLLDDDMASLIEIGIGNESTILVDEDTR